MRNLAREGRFRDPYANELFAENGYTQGLGDKSSQTRVSAGKWEATQVFRQPFRKDNFSYSVFDTGEISFRMRFEDFPETARKIVNEGKEKYYLNAGFFWYQR